MKEINWTNLIAWYGYDEIFKDIKLPTLINKELLLNNIISKIDILTPIYVDMPILNLKIQNFFLTNYDIYDRLSKAFKLEYDVIENYDRIEESTTKENENSNLNTTNKNNFENIDSISAYDSNSFTNSNKNASNNTEQNTSTNNVDKNTIISSRIHGNIGVTTSQQMLESELKLRPKMNIYEIISNDFMNEFSLAI